MTSADLSLSWQSSFSSGDGHESQWTTSSLKFIRDCIDSTPLRHQTRMSVRDIEQDASLRDCVARGLQLFATDLSRWSIAPESPEHLFNRLLFSPSLQATFFYRACHQLYTKNIAFWPDILSTVSRILSGVEIYYSADIGPGLKLIHGVGTVIGAKSRIGRNFTVFQGVTIGDKLGAETGGRPEIENDVILSAGAQVLGPVTIASKTIVGANSVVIRSTPGRCVVAGVPAQIKAEGLSDAKWNEFIKAIKG